jgi:glycine/D-amino acid oxidase-like deaminating enzyme
MEKQHWLTAFVHELHRLRVDIPRRDAHRAGLALYGDGTAAPAAVAKHFAAEWEGWITSFVEELQRLRPTMNAKLCKTIGMIRYAQEAHCDPREAAQNYAKSQQGRRPR